MPYRRKILSLECLASFTTSAETAICCFVWSDVLELNQTLKVLQTRALPPGSRHKFNGARRGIRTLKPERRFLRPLCLPFHHSREFYFIGVLLRQSLWGPLHDIDASSRSNALGILTIRNQTNHLCRKVDK